MSSPRNTAGHAVTKSWKWLDPVAGFFGAIVRAVYGLPGMRAVKTLLHGTWPLRHPLHPAATDFTVGGYTILFALDLFYLVTRDATLVRAADFVLVVSLLSSVVSIVSGLTDWNETYAEERRTGILHGLLMLIASLGFVTSLWLRVGGAPDQRDLAITFSIVAYVVLTVSAYFGGEMVFGYGTEVNRQAWTEAPTKWERLDVKPESLEDRKPVVAKAKNGMPIFVVRLDGKVYAMGNTCTHAGGPLNEGTWVGSERCEIQCPWHASRFCVKDAEVHGGPATFSELRFDVRTSDQGYIEVRAAD